MNKLLFFTGFIFLFFMLIFPSVFQEIKYTSLFFLTIFAIFEWILKKRKIRKGFFISLVIWYLYFSFSLLIGVSNGFKVDFELVNIYFITPILAVILSSLISNNTRFIYLNRILIFITFCICIFDFIYLLNKVNILSLPFEINSEIFGSSVLTDEKVEFRISNQSSLMFLLPYVITIFFSKGYNRKHEQKFILLTIILGVILSLFSGRRALEVVVAISFLLSYLLNIKIKGFGLKIYKSKLRGSIKNILFSLVLIIIFLINFFPTVKAFDNFTNSIYITFVKAFDPNDESLNVRAEQSIKLYDGWMESPLYGHGLNAHVKSYIRSVDTPWSYEHVYQALLFQTGIIGFGIVFIYIILIIFNLYKKTSKLNSIENKYILGILVGFVCFIIAGATNPMVYYLWAWTFVLISYQKIFNINNEK